MAMTTANKQPVTTIVQFDKSDPVWNQTPKMGVEALIATVENEEELTHKLIELIKYHKNMKRALLARDSSDNLITACYPVDDNDSKVLMRLDFTK